MNNDEKIKFLEEILNMINEKIQNNHKQIKNLNKMLVELKEENNKLLPKSNDIYAQIKGLRDSIQNEVVCNSSMTLSKSSLFESCSMQPFVMVRGESGSPNPYNSAGGVGGQVHLNNFVSANPSSYSSDAHMLNKTPKYSIPLEDLDSSNYESFLKKYKEDNNL